jgi:hypothetical protein
MGAAVTELSEHQQNRKHIAQFVHKTSSIECALSPGYTSFNDQIIERERPVLDDDRTSQSGISAVV